jgi:hypothetical protein
VSVVSLCPFPVAPLLWRTASGEPSLTLCVKMTLRLEHGAVARLAEAQEPIEGDRFWGEGPLATLRAPSDLAPLKPKVDVVLVGHAYAPAGTQAAVVKARLRVDHFTKAVRVIGDRDEPGAAPAPFARLPLRYERAARGPGNPAGLDARGGAFLPNVEPERPGDLGGFGPISPAWSSRRRLLGDHARAWALAVARGKHVDACAPPELDLAFFNSAPPEQQIDLLSAAAVIELEGLRPDRARFEARLPGVRPKAFVEEPETGRVREIALRCDTLWIEADEAIATLTFRGLTSARSAREEDLPRIVVAEHSPDHPVHVEAIERSLARGKLDAAALAKARAGDRHPLGVRHDAVKRQRKLEVFWSIGGAAPPPAVEAPAPERPSRSAAVATAELRGVAPGDLLPFARPPGVQAAGDAVATAELAASGAPDLPNAPADAGRATPSSEPVKLDVADYARLVAAIERGEGRLAALRLGVELAAVPRIVASYALRAAADAAFAAALAVEVGAARDRDDLGLGDDAESLTPLGSPPPSLR